MAPRSSHHVTLRPPSFTLHDGNESSLPTWKARPRHREPLQGGPFRPILPTPRSAQIQDDRDFISERNRLLDLMTQVHGRGATAMEGHPNPIFGPITARQWSNLLRKHLDHHLRPFGV